jgi:hypothetical protein
MAVILREKAAPECALGRLCDSDISLSFHGNRHSGKERERHELNFMKSWK